MAGTRVVVEEVDDSTPPPSARRIRLETADQVRAGKLAPDLGTKLIYMLTQIARVTDPAALERRLIALEDELRRNRHEPERIGRTPAQG